VLGSIGVLRDLTSHRRTELALEEARHLARIGEMSATVAHDIKNPLAAIHAAVQYLSREESSPEERVEMLGEISKEVRRVDETIHDLLRFSRPRPPDLEPTLVSELVQGTLAELKLTVELGQQGLDVAVEPGLSVPLDRRMMRRVLHNLLVNAFQATEEVGPAMDGPGQVTVRAWSDGDRAVIEVRDSGTGVADGLKLQLFEPFVTSKVRGTGLGLAVARRFVEAHGGEIRLHASDSSGSSFRLWLPRTGC
jgi:two-component system sensor histidine kinase PilS (NtrC family)